MTPFQKRQAEKILSMYNNAPDLIKSEELGGEMVKGGPGSGRKAGSASFGQFKNYSKEQLSKLNKLAKQAKEKNSQGKILSEEEQYALDNHADIQIELNKSEDDEDLEKGGEGSRGGKVIGHTKSGKPVYAHRNPFYHKGFEDWSKDDHKDAIKHHENHALFAEQKAKHLYSKGKHDESAEYAKKIEHHKDIARYHKNLIKEE